MWREENKHNLQIRHVAASTPRVNQGVEPWVSQRPLASHCVSVVEVRVLSDVESNLAGQIQADTKVTLRADALDRAEFLGSRPLVLSMVP